MATGSVRSTFPNNENIHKQDFCYSGTQPNNLEYTALEGGILNGPSVHPTTSAQQIGSFASPMSGNMSTSARIDSLMPAEVAVAVLVPAFVGIRKGEPGGMVWSLPAVMSFWLIIRHQVLDRETARTALTAWSTAAALLLWLVYAIIGWGFVLWAAVYYFLNAMVLVGFMIYEVVRLNYRNQYDTL